MATIDILESKYAEIKEDESKKDYIRRCVKILESRMGFTEAHEELKEQFKVQGLEGRELTNVVVYITNNEKHYVRALVNI